MSMSFICSKCGYENTERDNIYGTICLKCAAFIAPKTKPKFIIEIENKISYNQNVIRQYLKQKMLGDNNGNKIEQKD